MTLLSHQLRWGHRVADCWGLLQSRLVSWWSRWARDVCWLLHKHHRWLHRFHEVRKGQNSEWRVVWGLGWQRAGYAYLTLESAVLSLGGQFFRGYDLLTLCNCWLGTGWCKQFEPWCRSDRMFSQCQSHLITQYYECSVHLVGWTCHCKIMIGLFQEWLMDLHVQI